MPFAHTDSQSLQFYEFGLDDVTDDITWYKLGELYQDLNGPCAWNCFCFCFLPQNAAKQKFRDNSENWTSGATFNIHVALAIVSGFSLGSSLPCFFETRPFTEFRAHRWLDWLSIKPQRSSNFSLLDLGLQVPATTPGSLSVSLSNGCWEFKVSPHACTGQALSW